MRKILIIAVALFALLFIFTACTVNEQNGTEISPPNNSDSEAGGEAGGIPDEEAPPIADEKPAPDDTDNGESEAIKPITVSYIRSKVNSLRVRSQPSLSSSVLGSIDSGELLIYVGVSGGFYITRFKEKTAYISADKANTEIVLLISSGNTAIEKALNIGADLMGIPYELGAERLHWGNGIINNKFTGLTYDCSSLMQYIYYKSNKTLLDVTTRTQVLQGESVSRSNLKRGDLLFFTNSYRYNFAGVERIGHVGVFLGDNYMLHTASDHALIEHISSSRWSYYITARRVVK